MHRLKFLPLIFWPALLYFVIVAITLCLKDFSFNFNAEVLAVRGIFVALFAVLLLVKRFLPERAFAFASIIFVYASLGLLYKETAVLNRFFTPALDPKLILWDEKIFGFQPALAFSEKISAPVFSELMFFGYFSYYLLPVIVLFTLRKEEVSRVVEFGFLLITSFLLYYLIFICFPAYGPQYYFPAPFNHIEAQGFFGNLVKVIQELGEAPTAAFPSSHVGISWIVLFWLFRNRKMSAVFLLPFVLILMAATVYIKAHYFVDVAAGFITAPFIGFVALVLFKKIKCLSKSVS